MALDFEDYNKSFEEIVENLEEEVDSKLRAIRRQCVREFIDNLNRRNREWDTTFHELLIKSQQDSTQTFGSNNPLAPLKSSFVYSDPPLTRHVDLIAPLASPTPRDDTSVGQPLTFEGLNLGNNEPESTALAKEKKPQQDPSKPAADEQPKQTSEQIEFNDPKFSNSFAIQEFVRIQELLENNRGLFCDINTNPKFKNFKNEINIFIRTQINSISNSDSQHLNTKIRLLSDLFLGQRIRFQDRQVTATHHTHGQLFAMDSAAQMFVSVGTRLVNSVPAIAKSMASVINGISKLDNLAVFKDLVIGHLQEQCPYLIPMQPSFESVAVDDKDREVRYRIACGYNHDPKTHTLESEEKYLSRMRGMVLIYACILSQHDIGQLWRWLASFLSMRPEPVISATVLQAFLQEASKRMSSSYGRQYKKLIVLMRGQYMKLMEEVTSKGSDRQSLVKLKNLISDDSNLFESPKVSSIFGAVRLGS